MQFDKIFFKGTWGIYFELQVDIKQKTLLYVSQAANGSNLWSYKFKLTDEDMVYLEPYLYLKSEFFSDERLSSMNLTSDFFPLL